MTACKGITQKSISDFSTADSIFVFQVVSLTPINNKNYYPDCISVF